jgi:hypothetical protein
MMIKSRKVSTVYLPQTEILKADKGLGARTILASPLVAAATAVEGKIIDVTQNVL